MTKTLRKAIMKRSKLRKKFNEERNIENWSQYKRQHNLGSNLLKHSKKRHFKSLNVKDVTENKNFWNTIKAFFTEKNKTTANIILEKLPSKLDGLSSSNDIPISITKNFATC